MKIQILIKGNFEYLKEEDSYFTIEVDLKKMAEEDKTFNDIIIEHLEDIDKEGCSCSFNESQNHCECECNGFTYEYEIKEFFN